MLVADNAEGRRIMATTSDRETPAFCPVCRDQLTYKRGRVVVAHWAHRAAADCDHGEGESREHMAMKLAIHQHLTEAGLGVGLEVPYDCRRADVEVTTRKGNVFVIECQASAISIEEMAARTTDYAAVGVPVTWVWWHRRIKWDKPGVNGEAAFPKEILHVADRHPFATIYVADVAHDEGIWVWRLGLGEPRWRHSEWTDPDGEVQERSYLPKTFRAIMDEAPAIYPECNPRFLPEDMWLGGPHHTTTIDIASRPPARVAA